MLTSEELRLRKLKRRRRATIAGILLVALTVAFFSARPTFRAIKGWQARRHAARAFALIEQEKWSEARDSAVAAYQLRRSEPQALRSVARLLSRTGQQQALEFWDQLAEKEPLTRDDLRDLAAIAMASGDAARSETALAKLLAPESGQPLPADWLLAARAAAQGLEPIRAHQYIGRILADPASTERQQFQAALLGAALPSDSPEETQRQHAEAWSRIVQISRSDTATGLDALLLLAQQAVSRSVTAAAAQGTNLGGTAASTGSSAAVPSANAEDNDASDMVAPPEPAQPIPPMTELADAIERHPLARPSQKLLAVDLRTQADPSHRNALIDAAVEQWKDADVTGLAALTSWLNGKGQHERVLALLPLEKAMEERETFLQYVDALGALGRWQAIRELLETERFPLDPVLQRMYLARCYVQLGQKAAAENNWQRALETAGADVQKLIVLGDYAEKNEALSVAEEAYRAAAREAPKLRGAQQGRLRAALRSRDTKKIHAVLAEMLELWPNDPAIQNDEAYQRLLLLPKGPGAAEATEAMRSQSGTRTPTGTSANSEAIHDELDQIELLGLKLVQRNPTSLPQRTLLALARLKQGRPAEALAVYENIQIAPQALTPSALAVHAAVLAADGHMDDARTEASQVAVDSLLPEERALIAGLL